MGKGREFTFKEKLEIITHYESLVASWMELSKKKLTEWANVNFDTSVLHMTIGRVVKKKYSLITFDVGHLASAMSRSGASYFQLVYTHVREGRNHI